MLDLTYIGTTWFVNFFEKMGGTLLYWSGRKIGRNHILGSKWEKFKKKIFSEVGPYYKDIMPKIRNFSQTYHFQSSKPFRNGPKIPHFSPKTYMCPYSPVQAPRSLLLALGTSPRQVLLIMQPNMDCPKKVGSKILSHLTSSTLKFALLQHYLL